MTHQQVKAHEARVKLKLKLKLELKLELKSRALSRAALHFDLALKFAIPRCARATLMMPSRLLPLVELLQRAARLSCARLVLLATATTMTAITRAASAP